MLWWFQLLIAVSAVFSALKLGVIAEGVFALRDAIASLENSIQQISKEHEPPSIAKLMQESHFGEE